MTHSCLEKKLVGLFDPSLPWREDQMAQSLSLIADSYQLVTNTPQNDRISTSLKESFPLFFYEMLFKSVMARSLSPLQLLIESLPTLRNCIFCLDTHFFYFILDICDSFYLSLSPVLNYFKRKKKSLNLQELANSFNASQTRRQL